MPAVKIILDALPAPGKIKYRDKCRIEEWQGPVFCTNFACPGSGTDRGMAFCTYQTDCLKKTIFAQNSNHFTLYIFNKSAEASAYVSGEQAKGHTVAFVPTMGALHDGHASLIELARQKANLVVCSIFVNPTQFTEKQDYEKYPSTLEEDKEMLIKAGCDLLFLPAAAEIYPYGPVRQAPFDFSPLDRVMEAVHRPGHFDGMAQVVKILLDIIHPDFLLMGQKDFQQQLIVKKLVKWMGIHTEVITCPIIREKNGLAMSSRNRRLSDKMRNEAGSIAQAILYAADKIKNADKNTDEQSGYSIRYARIEEIEREATKMINSSGNIEVEYFEIADINDLSPLKKIPVKGDIVICTAVRTEGVRLIDNMILSLD